MPPRALGTRVRLSPASLIHCADHPSVPFRLAIHCIVAAQSPAQPPQTPLPAATGPTRHGHRTATAWPTHGHCTAQPSHSCRTAATQPPHSHCTAQPPHRHCHFAAQPLHSRCTVAVQVPHSYCSSPCAGGKRGELCAWDVAQVRDMHMHKDMRTQMCVQTCAKVYVQHGHACGHVHARKRVHVSE